MFADTIVSKTHPKSNYWKRKIKLTLCAIINIIADEDRKRQDKNFLFNLIVRP